MYNASTGKFVMWMHKENGADYSEARAAVAVSDTVDGNYTWQGSFRPLGQHMSRDITVFVDTDGTGYMISAARENYDLQIYRLTADYTGIAALVANPWHGGHREAPALFKRGGVYFMLTSGATGWNPNQQQYATATSIAGPWTAMTNVGDSTTYGSQTAYVLPVQGDFGHLVPLPGRPLGQLLRRHRQRLPLRLAAADLPQPRPRCPCPGPRRSPSTRPPGRSPATSATYNTLIARHSAKCADVTSQSLWPGAQIKQYTATAATTRSTGSSPSAAATTS